MEKEDGEKLLPDLKFSDVGMKKKESGDTPAEEPEERDKDIEKNSGNESSSDSSSSSSDSDSSTDSDSDDEYKCDICNKKISGYLPYKQHLKGKQHAKAVSRKKKEKKLLKMGDLEKFEQDDDDDHLFQKSYAVCETCDKQFSGFEPYKAHLKSKVHKRKVFEQSVLEKAKENDGINLEKLAELYKSKRSTVGADEDHSPVKLERERENLNEEFECKECGNVFNALKPFAQHLGSKTHAKKVEKNKMLEKVIKKPETSGSGESSDKPRENDINTLVVEDDVLVCMVCTVSFSGPESALMHIKSKSHLKKVEKYIKKVERKKKIKEMQENLIESLCSMLGSSAVNTEAGPAKENIEENDEQETMLNEDTLDKPQTSGDA